MRMKRNIFITITMVLLLLTGCKDGWVFSHYDHATTVGWEKNDAISFDIPPLEESGTYAMTLGLRLTDEFPFRNLHLVVQQTAYPSKRKHTDLVVCKVVDTQGSMLGNGVSLYQYTLPVRKDFFKHGDSIHVEVKHNMKREILPGIADVGIILKKDK